MKWSVTNAFEVTPPRPSAQSQKTQTEVREPTTYPPLWEAIETQHFPLPALTDLTLELAGPRDWPKAPRG